MRYEILERDTAGRARRVRVDGHQVQLDHLDSSGMMLACCYTHDGQSCEANGTGICGHSLEALFHAADSAGVGITTCLRQDAAEQVARRIGGRVAFYFRSGQDTGQIGQWVVVGRVS